MQWEAQLWHRATHQLPQASQRFEQWDSEAAAQPIAPPCLPAFPIAAQMYAAEHC
jgi:hypothetical protein